MAPYSLRCLPRLFTSSSADANKTQRVLSLVYPKSRPAHCHPPLWSLLLGLRIRLRLLELGNGSVDMYATFISDTWDSADLRQTRPKAAFYAVHAGRKPGVYTTWSEAEAQVKGFTG